jgi:lipopolysaccharide biosynthesis glycosyltransferase
MGIFFLSRSKALANTYLYVVMRAEERCPQLSKLCKSYSCFPVKYFEPKHTWKKSRESHYAYGYAMLKMNLHDHVPEHLSTAIAMDSDTVAVGSVRMDHLCLRSASSLHENRDWP